MHRVLIPPQAVQGDRILIQDPRTVHHLVRVLRVKAGERFQCLDGQGRIAEGTVAEVESRRVIVAVERKLEEPAPRVTITLAQALIESANFEWALQKATELGAHRIIPVMTSRTSRRPSARNPVPRLTRWRRIIESAAAQAGRARLPVLEEPLAFAETLTLLASEAVLLPTLVEDGPSLSAQLRRLNEATRLAVLIGPEGDFSPEEVALAKQHGARTVTLGRHVLRSETAALVSLAILQQTVGQL